MRIETTQAAGEGYASAFIGPVDHRRNINVDVTALPADTGSGGALDADGVLKPNYPLQDTGAPISAPGQRAVVTVEARKLLKDNVAATIAAGGTRMIGCADRGQVNRKIMEDTMGRALTADEISALDAGNFSLVE